MKTFKFPAGEATATVTPNGTLVVAERLDGRMRFGAFVAGQITLQEYCRRLLEGSPCGY